MKLVILMLLLSVGVFAEHEIRHINKELTHLGLSKKQSETIKTVLQEFKRELKAFREYESEIEEKRKNLFSKDGLDVYQLKRLNYELFKKANDIETKLLRGIHVVLNKQQKNEFVRYFDEWKVK